MIPHLIYPAQNGGGLWGWVILCCWACALAAWLCWLVSFLVFGFVCCRADPPVLWGPLPACLCYNVMPPNHLHTSNIKCLGLTFPPNCKRCLASVKVCHSKWYKIIYIVGQTFLFSFTNKILIFPKINYFQWT